MAGIGMYKDATWTIIFSHVTQQCSRWRYRPSASTVIS